MKNKYLYSTLGKSFTLISRLRKCQEVLTALGDNTSSLGGCDGRQRYLMMELSLVALH